MKIGVLGAGSVGARLAALLRAAGHEAVVGSRKGPVSLIEAATDGEMVVIALPYTACAQALPPLAGALAQKIVIDATNPLQDDWSPLLLGQETSAAEEIQRRLPASRLVKAFNTIFADVMTPERIQRPGGAVTAFIASDQAEALGAVGSLAAAMGFAPVTINKLSAARQLEAMATLNIELAVGQGGGTNAAFLYDRAAP